MLQGSSRRRHMVQPQCTIAFVVEQCKINTRSANAFQNSCHEVPERAISGDLGSLAGAGTAAAPRPIVVARVLGATFLRMSLLADFWVCRTDLQWVVLVLPSPLAIILKQASRSIRRFARGVHRHFRRIK